MAQEGSNASVASSYITPNGSDIHANPLPSWPAMACWPPTNAGRFTDAPSEEDSISISFTNLSNHSGSSTDSSTSNLSGEPPDNHMWSHVLLLTNLSNQVRNLSIAPPYPQNNNHHQIGPCNDSISIVPPLDLYSMSMLKEPNTAYPPYIHEFKGNVQHHEIGPSEPYNKFNDGLTDVVSFNAFLNKLPALGFRSSSPSMNAADLSSNNKKQGYHTSPLTRGSGRGRGSTIERKKKRSDDSSDAVLFKKSKRETSSAASLKMQAAKPKMDRISALQQIVSPYGKTDTASVLLAAVEYITALQEQIQNNNHHQIGPCNDSISIVPPLDLYSMSMLKEPNTAYPPYIHEFKGNVQHHEIGPSEPYNKFNDGLTDVVSFNAFLNKLPALGFRSSSPSMNAADLSSNNKKQGYHTSPLTWGSGRGRGSTIERKKKRSDDSSDAVLFKKSKRETSFVASLKIQAAKPKMDRISALQQIVSPYGKTDTASVLLAAVEYITALQEQIQLLSDPYMRSSANKDINSQSGMEREEKLESTLDLKSRGLCLVSISSTTQVYLDNNGPDYLTPTYK